ncbi:MAG: SufE family protein [Paludibacteraceae bacterium]|nr:SufE family protein [Paludibacteraceae bacterium]
MAINQLQDEIIEEFTFLDDWVDRYELIIDYGKNLPTLPEADKTDNNLIDGCQSKVWLTAELDRTNPNQPIVIFHGDSDALLVRGIVALLIKVLSGHAPKEIVDADLYFIDKIGLQEHLSPTRNNGVVAMLKQMRLFALAYLSVLK